MPLYEYECPSCGTFERIQRFSDPILRKCPDCGKPVKKHLSPPALQFKGSGWYVTDYAGKGKTDNEEGAKPEGPKAKEPSAAKSKGKKS